MSDIHALSGAYAVDALDDIERAQFQRHLETCDTCRRETDSFQDTSAFLGDLVAVAPPASLRDRVLADIVTVRPLPPAPGPQIRSGSWWRRPTTFLAAAAAALIIGTGAVTVQQATDPAPSQVEVVLAADDAERFTQTFDGGATATVVRSKSLNRAVILTEDMPEAPDGHAYMLWLQHDDVMVPAGVMPPGADNKVVLVGDPATAQAVGITVETVGGKHAEPEGDVVAIFDFKQA